ncbi:flavin-containing monooxygenase 5-like [Megaptera novaeangliae]
MEYLQMYVKPFHLLKHIRFLVSGAETTQHAWNPLARAKSQARAKGNVVVQTEGKQESYVFDGIMVCSGLETDPFMPLHNFPCMSYRMLSWEYKSPEKFHGKKIIVIGIGNSGGDLAIELSHVAAPMLNNPCDTRRVQCKDYVDEIASEIGVKPNLFSLFLWDPKLALEIFFGPCTPYQYHLQGPGKWAGARGAILTQREQIIKPLRTRILNGDQAPYSVPFWLKSVCIFGSIPLQGISFSITQDKPFPGPQSTLTGRSALSPSAIGLGQLPSVKNMMADIAQRERAMEKRYVKTPRHTIQVDHIEYMDKIAARVGVKPNLLFLFLSDPMLAMEVLFGPCTPYQYCLQGPGKWAGAQRAILTQRERIIKPLRTRITSQDSHSSSPLSWIKMAPFGLAFLAAGLAYFRYIHHCKWK